MMTQDLMVPLWADVSVEDMERLNRFTERRAPQLGLRANRARSVIIRQMLREFLDRVEAEHGEAPLAA